MSKRQMLGVLAATTLVAMLVGMQLSGTLVAGAALTGGQGGCGRVRRTWAK